MRASAALLALLLLAGCAAAGQPMLTELEPAPAAWELEAVDSAGPFGHITVEAGPVAPLPPAWVAADPQRTHAQLVHFSYEIKRAGAEGYGGIDWRYSSPGDGGGILIVEEPPREITAGVGVGVEESLPVRAPGSSDDIEGWLMLTLAEGNLAEPITLSYQPTGEQFVINGP